MSHMKVSKEKDRSLQDSRRRVREALNIAFGSYIEQEATKGDNWRRQDFGKLYAHLKHELWEISRSKSKTTQIHNCIDACGLSAILIAKLIESEEKPRLRLWLDNLYCPLCGKKVDPHIRSRETGLNYCSHECAKKHLRLLCEESE